MKLELLISAFVLKSSSELVAALYLFTAHEEHCKDSFHYLVGFSALEYGSSDGHDDERVEQL